MNSLQTRLILIVGMAIIMIGGSRIYDRSGPLGIVSDDLSGSLITQYRTLSDEAPRRGASDVVRSYMQGGVIDQTARVIQPQQTLVSDLFWLRNIQHVGTYVLRDEAPGLIDMMRDLTALSPRRTTPYIFVQYIGPQQAPQGSTPTPLHKKSRSDTVAIGEDGIRMTCDMTKVATITQLSDERFVQLIEYGGTAYEEFRSPCDDYSLPHTLAFNYFHYLHDIDQAIAYYKVAAFDPDAPRITTMMPALLRSKQGKHLVSAQLWFDRALALSSETDDTRIQSSYQRAISKAINELQLHLLEQATASSDCDHDYRCLVQTGALRVAISTIRDTCAVDVDTIVCVLLGLGGEGAYIVPDGTLIDPLSTPLSDHRVYDDAWGWRVE